MAELFEQVVALVESKSSTRALATRFRIESRQAAGNGVVLCLPILIAEFSRLADDPSRSASLLKTLRSIDTFGLNDPGAAIEGNLYEPVGSKLVDALLGDGRRSISDAISAEVGIGRQSADCLLPPAAWVILTTIADRHGNRMGRHVLSNVLATELQGLLDAGWGPWLEAVGSSGVEIDQSDPPGAPTDNDLYSAHKDDYDRYGLAQESVTFEDYGDFGLPEGNDPASGYVLSQDYAQYGARATGDIASPALANRSALQSGGSVGLGSHHHLVGAALLDEPIPEEASPSRIPYVLVGVAAVLIGILGVYQFIGGGDGDDETAAIEDGASADDGESPGEDGGATLGDPEQVAPDPFGEGPQGDAANSVQLDLIVSDPQGLSGSVGSLQLRFDLDAQEVCYNVTADLLVAPYDGHIHAGPIGQTGEVVVGFGQLSNGDFGCTQVDGARLNQILNDRANFYVDLHDASGVDSIRAQLSEATVANDDPNRDAGGDGGQGLSGIAYEPRGDGAFFRIEAGRLVLTGVVASEEIADRVVAEFADIAGSGLEVVNESTVAADAPAPSGRITMDNTGLFQLGSDQLSAGRGTVIADLAAVLVARPTWRVTIIGHTDATGSETLNLSLSLGRARAVLAELVANGVAEDKVTADGAGSSRPVADNATPEGQAHNRRIEFIVDRG